MSKPWTPRSATLLGLGLAAGVGLGLAPACAGKHKHSRNPEECMRSCEQDRCAYDPNSTGNDAYLACLAACEDECG